MSLYVYQQLVVQLLIEQQLVDQQLVDQQLVDQQLVDQQLVDQHVRPKSVLFGVYAGLKNLIEVFGGDPENAQT